MKRLLTSAPSLVLALFLSFSAQAKTSLEDITHTWSGLTQTGRQTNLITLTLEADPTTTAPAIDAIESRMARRRAATPGQFAAMQFGAGLPLKGMVTIEPAKFEALNRRTPPVFTADVQGELLPELNIIKLQYSDPRAGKITLIGALTQDQSRLAVVTGGPAYRNSLPFYLVSGTTLPQHLQVFASPKQELDNARAQAEIQTTANQVTQQTLQMEMQNLRLEMQQAYAAADKAKIDAINQQLLELGKRSSEAITQQLQQQLQQVQQLQAQQVEQQKKAQDATAGLTQSMTELQQQMLKALQSGDIETAKRLQEELKSLGQQRAAAMTGRAFTPITTTNSNSCSDDLLVWAAEMDKNGASAAQFDGLVLLSNLFRPSVFSQYFDTDLLTMDPAKRRGYLYELRQNCSRQQHPFTRGSNINTVANAFGEDSPEYNYISAALAGEALDYIDQWQQTTLSDLANGNNSEQLQLLQRQGHDLLAALWPTETTAANGQIVELIDQSIFKQLTAAINLQASKASTGDKDALINLGNLRHQPDWATLSPEKKSALDTYFSQKTSPLLKQFIEQSFPANTNTGKPRPALIAGKQWYEANARALALFANTEAVQSFNQRFVQQREAHYQSLFSELKNEIATLNDKSAVNSFGREFNLALDSQGSKTWQALNNAKTQRLIELDRAAFVARVGAGPFKPEEPGAIYLNALYRNDTQTIAAEDKAYAIPLMKLMEPLTNSGIYELFEVFSGGMVDANSIKDRMRSEMANSSMSTTLAGFFVIAYEHLLPQCLGPNPIEFERIESWDEVVTNGLGMELSRTSHSRTYNYTIAQRHAQVFRKIGDTTSPENLDFVNSLFGGLGLIPSEARDAIDTLSSNLRGLRIAMQTYSCDSEVIKTLETNLISQAMSR